jgi:hypothetical protein
MMNCFRNSLVTPFEANAMGFGLHGLAAVQVLALNRKFRRYRPIDHGVHGSVGEQRRIGRISDCTHR